ncbi:hypothetical protein Acr_26g0004800 [Actinidia rufa]|uniref:Uncharacterized protein n=1 Tax=Actinidia rufa TaxID=165716 RepID=A0A7J0H291_9ERIC|nr:hypothetical protein Acr_26g0004800 [Actinidia rufa]
MADKASRGMVVYGDGLARFINESHTHLHALASRAFCGFLSLPISPPSGPFPLLSPFPSFSSAPVPATTNQRQDSTCGREFYTELRRKGPPSFLPSGQKAEDPALIRVMGQPLSPVTSTPRHSKFHGQVKKHLPNLCSSTAPLPQWSGSMIAETEDARIVREFAQIIDAYEAYYDTCGEDAVCLVPSISDRFMGMRSAIITNNSSLKTFGGKLGCTVLQLSDIIDDNHPNADLPIDVVASELLKLLGFQEGKTSETSRFDLVFIHIGDGENNSKKDTEYVNHLVGQIMHIADTGSEISSCLHMSVVMSYGTVSEDDDTNLSFVFGDGNNSDLTLLFPCQSYMVKGRNLRNNVRYHSPMLLAQWQNAVTRKDVAETFSFKDFKEASFASTKLLQQKLMPAARVHRAPKEALGYCVDTTLLLLLSLNASDFFEKLVAEDAEVAGVGKSADQRRAVIADS